MSGYRAITIIYNPNSTGPSERLAKELRDGLRVAMPEQTIHLLATKHAGHAEELAYKAARVAGTSLIVSASGDGGYHEVINGITRARLAGSDAIAGILPAGNANDHYTELHTTDLLSAIERKAIQQVDLLKLTTTIDGKPYSRYAHSYIGFGLTPKVGLELNKTNLNIFREVTIVMKGLFFLRPIRLMVDGKLRTYDSLVCSNIRKMSKVLSLSKRAKMDDGLFEITAFRRRGKLRLITALLRASTLGLKGDRHVSEFRCSTTNKLLVQLDGEIQTIDAASSVVITSERRALHCIV